jgi:hypothetical protein
MLLPARSLGMHSRHYIVVVVVVVVREKVDTL